MFNGKFKIWFFIDMSWRYLNTFIALLVSLILTINTKFDLKDNFVNNLKNSNAWRFLNSYALKAYEVRLLKQLFRGSNLVQKFGTSYKKRRQRQRHAKIEN